MAENSFPRFTVVLLVSMNKKAELTSQLRIGGDIFITSTFQNWFVVSQPNSNNMKLKKIDCFSYSFFYHIIDNRLCQ